MITNNCDYVHNSFHKPLQKRLSDTRHLFQQWYKGGGKTRISLGQSFPIFIICKPIRQADPSGKEQEFNQTMNAELKSHLNNEENHLLAGTWERRNWYWYGWFDCIGARVHLTLKSGVTRLIAIQRQGRGYWSIAQSFCNLPAHLSFARCLHCPTKLHAIVSGVTRDGMNYKCSSTVVFKLHVTTQMNGTVMWSIEGGNEQPPSPVVSSLPPLIASGIWQGANPVHIAIL